MTISPDGSDAGGLGATLRRLVDTVNIQIKRNKADVKSVRSKEGELYGSPEMVNSS